MLLSSSLCRAAGKGWGIKVKDFTPEPARGREAMCLTVHGWTVWGLFCFVLFFKPTISPAPSTAFGARSWLWFESLTHSCKGGHVFSELSVLVCQA